MIVPAPDTSAAILAGGNSTRMGRDKALVTLDGFPMIRHVHDTLRRVFEHVIIISDRTDAYKFLGSPVFPDVHKGLGPTAGIHSALTNMTTDRVFVVPCDMPFLSEAFFRYMRDYPSNGDACVLASEGVRNPLLGLYRRRCLTIVAAELLAGRSNPQRLLDMMETTVVTISENLDFYSPRLLENINHTADLRHTVAGPPRR
jgi:molybdopterin-guanine dinucleotide biosynthesis protein A